MQTAILNSNSEKDLKLLTDLAKKIGIKTKLLSETEIEEIGLSNAIKKGRTGKYVNTNKFLNELRK